MIKHVELTKNKCLEDFLLPLSCFSSSFLFSPHRPVSPAISVLLFLYRSAQQRSSQTNKSQSSAGNQVSVCHVLSVIHKQQSTRSREDCTPTQQQDDYCRENQKRETLKGKRSDPGSSFFFSKSFALHTFYVMYILSLCFLLLLLF